MDIKKIVDEAKGVTKKILGIKEPIVLPPGECEIVIDGTKWCKPMLPVVDDYLFTLCPINQYQLERGWPHPLAINICLYGSIYSDKFNWIGFIPFQLCDALRYTMTMYSRVDVHGRVELDGDYYKVTLKIPINQLTQQAYQILVTNQ